MSSRQSMTDAGGRFPRTAAVLDAAETARALRDTADELDAVATAAPGLEPGTLRRKVRALRLSAAERLASGEG